MCSLMLFALPLQVRRRALEVMEAVLRGGVMPPFSAVSTLFALTTDPARYLPPPSPTPRLPTPRLPTPHSPSQRAAWFCVICSGA